MYITKNIVATIPSYDDFECNKILKRENIETLPAKVLFLELIKYLVKYYPNIEDLMLYSNLELEKHGYKNLVEYMFKNCKVQIKNHIYPYIQFKIFLEIKINDENINQKIEKLLAVIEKNI